MIVCICCGESKSSTHFTSNQSRVTGRSAHCKECGVWLHLFRQVFPKTRNWNMNRALTRQRAAETRAKVAMEIPRGNPMTELYEAWGIRK